MIWSTESSCGPFCEPNIACDLLPYPYPGCVCKEGFFEDGQGNCVLQKDCPCGKNEEFNTCGGCEKICSDPDRPCQEGCVQQCECEEGFFRDSYGLCVRGDECEPFECPENMVWSSESGCGPFCQSNIVCDMLPYPYPSCVCEPGFFQDGQGQAISYL